MANSWRVSRRALRRRRGSGERGMVSVELALGILTLVAITAFLGWVLSVGITQARVNDAALRAARSIARGEEIATDQVAELAPPGSDVEISNRGGYTVVRVIAQASFAGFGSVTLTGVASYPTEPGQP